MEDEIVKTLKYFDHFEYPPTFDEVWIFLGKSSRKEKLNCYLEKMAAGDDITAEYIDENRYALQRSEEILKKYKNRYYQSKKYIEESLPILIGLKLIPTIKYIGYSGSLAMKNASGQSDIDLFIEIYDSSKEGIVKNFVDSALTQFTKSNVYKEWKLRGISNAISCMVGALNEQSDLKRSIISNGVIFYGKYSEPIKGNNYTLFNIETISEKNKRYRVFRKLFGRKEKGKIIKKGLVEGLGGKQISTRTFILPLEQTPIILKLLKKEKTNYSIIEINTD